VTEDYSTYCPCCGDDASVCECDHFEELGKAYQEINELKDKLEKAKAAPEK